MNFIIIGDKFQKRMKSKGCVGLIDIDNKTIIENQYQTIKQKFPLSKIIYVYGFEGKKFESFVQKNRLLKNNLITIYNNEYAKYGDVYSLFLASQYLNGKCCILSGHHILNKKLFDKFIPGHQSQIFINNEQKQRLGCVLNNNKIERISYDLDNYLSEIYYLAADHVEIIKNIIDNKEVYNYFIFEIINKLIDGNQNLKPYNHHISV